MSTKFTNGAGLTLYRRSVGFPSANTFSFCFWGRLDADTNDEQGFVGIFNSLARYFRIVTQSNGTVVQLQFNSGNGTNTVGAFTPAMGKWYFYAASYHTGGLQYFYQSSVTGNIIASSISQSGGGPIAGTMMIIGNRDTSAVEILNGSVCGLKMWSGVQLTEEEFAIEKRSIKPRRIADLHLFSPLLDYNDKTDFVGGIDWMSSGSVTTSDNPPVPWYGGSSTKTVIVASFDQPGGSQFGEFTINGFSEYGSLASVTRNSTLTVEGQTLLQNTSNINRTTNFSMDARSNIAQVANILKGTSIIVGVSSDLFHRAAVAQTTRFGSQSLTNLFVSPTSIRLGSLNIQSNADLAMLASIARSTSIRHDTNTNLFLDAQTAAIELGNFSVQSLSDFTVMANVAQSSNFTFSNQSDLFSICDLLKIASMSLGAETDLGNITSVRSFVGALSLGAESECIFPISNIVKVSIVQLGGETFLRFDAEVETTAIFNKEIFFLLPINMVGLSLGVRE